MADNFQPLCVRASRHSLSCPLDHIRMFDARRVERHARARALPGLPHEHAVDRVSRVRKLKCELPSVDGTRDARLVLGYWSFLGIWVIGHWSFGPGCFVRPQARVAPPRPLFALSPTPICGKTTAWHSVFIWQSISGRKAGA